jgi:tetratricopeptide (TPR) repeat protein
MPFEMGDCLGESEVVDLVEGRLDPSSVERVTIHIDACSRCRELVAAAARAAPVTDDPAPIARGASVGRYVVLDRVGVGSVGVVYSAYDPELDRKVALKLLRTDAFASAHAPTELRARLLREAQALARLSHPNVITVYDVGTHQGEVFIAMEFAKGGSLADWLHREARTQGAILRIFREVGEGLAAAHAAGIVHRDFKPDNVVLGEDERPRVSDFGLAAYGPAPPSEVGSPSPTSVTKTRTGALLGTPAYMAPEQWEGRAIDARTDVFAFSVALYEALQERRPFDGETLAELRAAVGRGDVRPMSRNVPARVRRALLRGLRARPEERFANMREFLDALASRRASSTRAVVALAAIVPIALLVGWSRRPAPALCTGAETAWGDVFDAAHEARVKDALAKTGSPSAEYVTANVSRTLADYRGAWIAMHTDACLATRARGQQSEALLDRRMRCLDERRRGARALVQSIETGAGADLAERAARAAAALPRVDDCADVRALAEPVPLPADLDKRKRVVDLSARAAEVEAGAVPDKEALGRVEPLLAEAKDLGWSPLVARLLYDRGSRRRTLRMNKEAEAALQEAAIAAESAQSEVYMVEAWIDLVYVVGYQGDRTDEGLLWGRYAEAALGRLGGDDRLERWNSNVGLVLINDETRIEEGIPYLERALAIAKARGVENAGLQRNVQRLGIAYDRMARYDKALEYAREAEALSRRVYGPESIGLAVSMLNEGGALVSLGRPAEAVSLYERSVAMQEKFGRNVAYSLTGVGDALRRTGRPDAALESDKRSLALSEANEAPDAYEVSYPVVGIALDLLQMGRFSDALPYAERAAKLRADTRHRAERGEARFALARALWATGKHAEATEAAVSAREDYRPTADRYGGESRVQLREIETWLASHGK